MLTKNLTGEDVLEAARKAREEKGPGYNEGVPGTQRPLPGRTKKEVRRDAAVIKELIYLNDVVGRRDLLVAAYYANRYRLSDAAYWVALKLVWMAAGSVDLLPMFRPLFASSRPWRQYLMTPEEEEALKAMPDPVTVWRAPRPGGDDGISWSVARAFVAEYANTHGRDILERQARKAEIVAYFDRRGEGEVIIL